MRSVKLVLALIIFPVLASAQNVLAPRVRAEQTGDWIVKTGTAPLSISIDQITTGDDGAPGSEPYLPVEIYDMQEGKEVQVTPIKELRTVSGHRLIGATFVNGFFDNNFWSSGTVTSGELDVSSGSLCLHASSSTTGAANGSAVIQSIRTARFVSGSANEFRGVIRISTGIPSSGTNDMRWGLADSTDVSTGSLKNGFYFRYSNGAFYVGSRLAGTEMNVATTSFNGTVPTITENYIRYQIVYTNLGASFYVNDLLAHKLTPQQVSLTETVNFKVRAQNVNSGGSNYDSHLEAKVLTVLRLGAERTDPTYKNYAAAASTVLKYGPGFLHHVTVNDPGNTGSSIAIYDSTFTAAANIIATLNTAKTSIGAVHYELPFNNGLYIVGTGTIGNFTIVYE
jgi:hypothetical protein